VPRPYLSRWKEALLWTAGFVSEEASPVRYLATLMSLEVSFWLCDQWAQVQQTRQRVPVRDASSAAPVSTAVYP
jgi:hypothetical protein